jgi:predicted O-methyltransferase YrrM
MEVVGGKNEGTTTTITTKKKGVGAGPVVTSCEIDDEAATMAQTYFDQSKYGNIIELRRGPAMDTLRQLRTDIDEGRRVPYDMVFLDADKRSYREYYDYLIGSRLLKVGGVILADNVLFKGLVTNSPGCSGGGGNGAVAQPEKKPLNYWKRRHQDIADALHEFNDYVNKDDRSSVVLLPLRDGLSIIRKK